MGCFQQMRCQKDSLKISALGSEVANRGVSLSLLPKRARPYFVECCTGYRRGDNKHQVTTYSHLMFTNMRSMLIFQ